MFNKLFSLIIGLVIGFGIFYAYQIYLEKNAEPEIGIDFSQIDNNKEGSFSGVIKNSIEFDGLNNK